MKSSRQHPTPRLLAKHAALMHTYGPDSARVRLFVTTHKDNRQFVKLAALARKAKKALRVRK